MTGRFLLTLAAPLLLAAETEAQRFVRAAGERELSWLPEGLERVRFQRLVPTDAGDGCRARLAGG